MDWFTADLHLDHENIIRLCNRPFRSVGQMNAVLIDNINATVGEDDRLFILGDIARRDIGRHMSQIVCRNVYFIIGNHDPYHRTKGYDGIDRDLYNHFHAVDKAMMISSRLTHDAGVVDCEIYLHHYACLAWPKSFHGSWHLYGHTHAKLRDNPLAFSMDVGVDAHDFKPLSIEQVAKFMRDRKRPHGEVLKAQRDLENPDWQEQDRNR